MQFPRNNDEKGSASCSARKRTTMTAKLPRMGVSVVAPADLFHCEK
jgi:hypothetical protein